MRMSRYLLLLLVLSGSAAASERAGGLVGVGTAFAHDQPGWMVRIESVAESHKSDDDEFISGGRVGIELWSAGGSTGMSFPVGGFIGGETDLARATLGGGVGLWAFDFSGVGDGVKGGVAPYLASSVQFSIGKMLVSIDARVSRQVIGEASDYNVYSVLLALGGRGR